MEALFRSLRDIPMTVSDPSVGIAKIAWWQQELRSAPAEGTQHPVARALLDSGALDQLDPGGFSDYLHGLVEELQEEPVADVEALAERLDRTAGQEAFLLSGDAGVASTSLRVAGNAARLLDLMRTLVRKDAEHRWLPMDLMARHQIRPGHASSAARDALVIDLADLAQDWRAAAPVDPAVCGHPGAGYVALRDGVVMRRLEEARKRPRSWVEQGRRALVGEVFSTWRLARRLGKAA